MSKNARSIITNHVNRWQTGAAPRCDYGTQARTLVAWQDAPRKRGLEHDNVTRTLALAAAALIDAGAAEDGLLQPHLMCVIDAMRQSLDFLDRLDGGLMWSLLADLAAAASFDLDRNVYID